MKDKELVKRAKKGDKDAFSLLYKQHLSPIYRFIFLKIGVKEVSEDLTSQVFLQAWRNIRKFKIGKSPFSSWLYQIARNLVIDFYRTYRKSYSLEEVAIENKDDIEEKIDLEDKRKIMMGALKELSEIHQTVLILRFIEELSDAEIAKIIGKKEGAVRVIQHRAIKMLKEKINGGDFKKFKRT